MSEAENRQAFEAWVTAPPREYSTHRWIEDSSAAWPGKYYELGVQLAWEAWQEAQKIYTCEK